MWAVLGLLTVLLQRGSGGASNYNYPQCTSGEQLMQLTKGSVQRVGNWTVWGECNLPNPRTDWAACGRFEASWVCDPDHLLTPADADELDQLLNRTASTSICRCQDECRDSGPRHKTVIALVNWGRVPNLSTGRVCEFGCASQVFPQLRPGSRVPFGPELDLMVDRITDHMLLAWDLSRCDDHVVIFYTKHYKRIQVKMGAIAAVRLRTTMHQALDAATPLFAEGDLKGALTTIVEQYYSRLASTNTTSKVLGIVLAILVGALLIFGLIVTIIYCRSEFAQGKDCGQVWAGMTGGHWATLFGGQKPKRSEKQTAEIDAELRNLDT